MSETEPTRILVVEDDLDTRENLVDILELDGYAVETAGSVRETLARDDWDTISVVILDWRLPDGDGATLLPRLGELAPHVEAIISTGAVNISGAIMALRHGAADYILKPINPDELRSTLERIVERRRIEEELRQERQFAETIVDTAHAIILVLDTEGRIVRFNPYLEELSGYRLGEVRGQYWFETFLPERDRPRIRALFNRAVADVETRGNINPIVTRDGTEREIIWWDRTLKDQHGNVTSLLAIGHDITELKQAQERLVQSERLAAIGEAMTGLAHESRNALQRAQSAAEMLNRRIADRPDLAEFVRRIQVAQDDLYQLYEEVREYAAPVRLKPRPCDLENVIREAWDQLDHQQDGRTVHFVVDGNDQDLSCELEPFAVRQVFRNVFDNALAACSDPVELKVCVRPVTLHERSALQVRVRDNGPGLTAEQREKIFDPFFTTKTHGTGLGMAICRRLIEAHTGEIDIGNGPPGTEVIVTLPRKQRDEE